MKRCCNYIYVFACYWLLLSYWLIGCADVLCIYYMYKKILTVHGCIPQSTGVKVQNGWLAGSPSTSGAVPRRHCLHVTSNLLVF